MLRRWFPIARPRSLSLLLLGAALATGAGGNAATAAAQELGAPNQSYTTQWVPRPAPPECVEARTTLILIDVSGSMRRHDLFGRAVRQVQAYIDEASSCEQILLARFGTTADLVGADFPSTRLVRATLKRAVGDLTATDDWTNCDEAAKVVEMVEATLRSTGGAGRLSVKFLTDGECDPSPGKPPFSLERFFASRLAGAGFDAVELRLTPRGELPSVTGYHGYATLPAPVDALKELLQRPVDVEADGSGEADAAPDGGEGGVEPALAGGADPPGDAEHGSGIAPVSRRLLPGGLFTAILLLVAGVLTLIGFLVRREARRNQLPAAPAPAVRTRGRPEPRVLEVTERRYPSAQATEQAQQLGRSRDVPALAGRPVVFGADRRTANHVCHPDAELGGKPLFQVVIEPDGGLRTLARDPRLRHDGEPIASAGVRTAPGEPLRLRLGSREWIITARQPKEHHAADRLFAAAAQPGGAAS